MSSFNLSLPVAIGSDHAGFEYKSRLADWLREQGFQVSDMGVNQSTSVDYPDYAHPVANAVEQREAAFGILICGSANGVCMTANKHAGIRAALCWQTDVAKVTRQSNTQRNRTNTVSCLPASDAGRLQIVFP